MTVDKWRLQSNDWRLFGDILVFQLLLNMTHAPLYICLGLGLLLGCALAHPAQDWMSSPDGRIVGGHETNIAVYPHQISLRRKAINSPKNPFSHICGGSIIAEDYILTAAHCVIASIASQYKIVADTSRRNGGDGVIVSVSEIIMHEKYFLSISQLFDLHFCSLVSHNKY